MTEKQKMYAVTNAAEALRDAREAVELFDRAVTDQAARQVLAIPLAIHIRKMQELAKKLCS